MGKALSKTKRFDDRLSLERARHELKKTQGQKKSKQAHPVKLLGLSNVPRAKKPCLETFFLVKFKVEYQRPRTCEHRLMASYPSVSHKKNECADLKASKSNSILTHIQNIGFGVGLSFQDLRQFPVRVD